MGVLDSIDWGALEHFFGEYGKLITASLALIVAVITLAVVIFRYLYTAAVERILGQGAIELEKQKAFYKKGKAALEQAKTVLQQQETEIKQREQRITNIRNAFIGKEHDLWCMHTARTPNSYEGSMRSQRRRPIIMVANLKGGVGKTTLTANLAAYFCENGKRVLLIDVDYQGSLSNMLLSADQVLDVPDGINDLLKSCDGLPDFHRAFVQFSNVLKGSAIVPARYQLASLENRLLIEYLLQDDHDDGRYRLARSLLSEEVSKTFDVAIIDAPPRLTAAAINAFCASTHLLVPTVYDKLSAEAVGTFLNGAHVLKGALNHGIDLLGIVGMLTSQQFSLSQREQDAKAVAMRQASQTWGPNHHFFDRHIPRKAAIAAAAGEEIAYYRDATVREWFDELGKAISERLWWDYGAPKDLQDRTIARLSPVVVTETTQENQKVMSR